ANLRKIIPLLGVQAALVLLEAGASDFGAALLAMAYAFAVLDLVILHKKRSFLGSSDFRRWCVIASIVLSVIATMLAPFIPWGWMRR
ncbi:MAG: hypothetical protein JWO82_808, partial [Akkermansiaceae bacterium]|nr:hypothetical protein [Akkermansiaceae bacterium]